MFRDPLKKALWPKLVATNMLSIFNSSSCDFHDGLGVSFVVFVILGDIVSLVGNEISAVEDGILWFFPNVFFHCCCWHPYSLWRCLQISILCDIKTDSVV
jgi:hypothetical protein